MFSQYRQVVQFLQVTKELSARWSDNMNLHHNKSLKSYNYIFVVFFSFG